MLYGLPARRYYVFRESRIDVLGLCCGFLDTVENSKNLTALLILFHEFVCVV